MNPLDQRRSAGEAGHYVVNVDPSMHINFVSKWHPTTNLATKCIEKSEKTTWRYNKTKVPQTRDYKMQLIYAQIRLNGQGSPELALEIRKIDNICNLLNIWKF